MHHAGSAPGPVGPLPIPVVEAALGVMLMTQRPERLVCAGGDMVERPSREVWRDAGRA
jgi:hypothetical protein